MKQIVITSDAAGIQITTVGQVTNLDIVGIIEAARLLARIEVCKRYGPATAETPAAADDGENTGNIKQ